jgi:hypothetical protein
MDSRMNPKPQPVLVRLLIAVPFLVVAGCGGVPDLGQSTGGGSGSGGLGDVVGVATSPYLTLELATGALSSLTSADPTAAEYKDTKMLFRRISGNGTDYFMSTLEVTQAQWARLAGGASTPWSTLTPAPAWLATAVGPDMPVFNLGYSPLTAALDSYNSGHGTQLGIPSDSEWTYACAGGSSATWSWGSVAGAPAVLANRAVVRESQLGVAGPRTVGGTNANAYGLFDMHGNVWEWTSPGVHVRGGSWFDPAWTARTSNMAGADDDADLAAGVAHALIGVRLTIRP